MNNDDGKFKKTINLIQKLKKNGGIGFELTCSYDGEEREGLEIE